MWIKRGISWNFLNFPRIEKWKSSRISRGLYPAIRKRIRKNTCKTGGLILIELLTNFKISFSSAIFVYSIIWNSRIIHWTRMIGHNMVSRSLKKASLSAWCVATNIVPQITLSSDPVESQTISTAVNILISGTFMANCIAIAICISWISNCYNSKSWTFLTYSSFQSICLTDLIKTKTFSARRCGYSSFKVTPELRATRSIVIYKHCVACLTSTWIWVALRNRKSW